MSAAAAAAPAGGAAGEAAPAKGGKKKLILLAVPLVLAAAGAGLWFSGVLPGLLGKGKPAAEAGEAHEAPKPDAHGAAKPDAHGAAKPDAHGAPKTDAHGAPKTDAHGAKAPNPAGKEGGHGTAAPRVAGAPIFAELPDTIANLNGGPRRTVYVKLRAKLELAKAEDEAMVQAALPRLQDLFQTYLREMRPEELRSSAGTYRLREELLARANIALAPARAQDLLFTEILIQ